MHLSFAAGSGWVIFSLARGAVHLSFAIGSGWVLFSLARGAVHLSFAIRMAVALPAVRRTSRGRLGRALCTPRPCASP
ncbi:hypothetical protein, partial [Pantoea sp.]|uniref:hypothetical protein n=1 Tax=Pantoea sp. TaxID=69393 RepID=UPI0031DD0E0B